MLSSVGYTDKRAEEILFVFHDLQMRNDVASPQVVMFAPTVCVLSVPLDRDVYEPSKTMSDVPRGAGALLFLSSALDFSIY